MVPRIRTTVQLGLWELAPVRRAGINLFFCPLKAICHASLPVFFLTLVVSFPFWLGLYSVCNLRWLSQSCLPICHGIFLLVSLFTFLRTSSAHLFQPGYMWDMQLVSEVQPVMQSGVSVQG